MFVPLECGDVHESLGRDPDVLARTGSRRRAASKRARSSFNAPGGRCERCEGAGVVTVDMQFLADVTVVCDVCDGRRFKPEVLEVRLRGRNVDELLATTVEEARELFADVRAIGPAPAARGSRALATRPSVSPPERSRAAKPSG